MSGLPADVPEMRAKAMRAEICAAFGWSPADVRVTPLAGGITNRNVLVDYAGLAPRRFVARFPGERTELLGIDRAHEVEATQRAAELGLCPAVLGALPRAGTLVTEFVDGVHLDGAAFAARLDEVVALVRAFHASGPLSGRFPIHRVVAWHARDALQMGIQPPAAYGELYHWSTRIESAFAAAPDPVVPCHNDLLPANVLFGERVWLLDFEYAGMNDRCFDLANLSINAGLDAAADERVLHAYFGAVTDRWRARLTLMKVMSEFREGMWAVVQQGISTLDTDFAGYAEERLASALRLTESIDADEVLLAASARR